MKWLLASLAFTTFAVAAHQKEEPLPYIVLISGPAEGYLSPCGCTDPMLGGIRRKATAVKQLGAEGRTLLIESAPFTHGQDRQAQLKAEAFGESLSAMQPAVAGLAAEDAHLGPAVIAAAQRLSKGSIVSSSVAFSEVEIAATKRQGPFLITSIDPNPALAAQLLLGEPVAERQALDRFKMEAELGELAPILITSGDEAEARRLAEANPWLKLIVYSRHSQAVREMVRVGDVVIAAAGEKGKTMLKLLWSDGRFTVQSAHDLGPEYDNDPTVADMFHTYKQRVAAEDLLKFVPREDVENFAGNEKCITCHADAAEVWKASEHAHALRTLEQEHSDRDPECVSCHVVGLDQVKGFKSRELTPNLTDVGCESCHGGGEAHAMKPYKHKMPKVGEASCRSCHVPEHSPEFSFEEYWPKIAH